jgi:hypothetical protein
MVEDGHLEAEGDEGETLIKVYTLYAGRKEGGGSHILQCEGTRVWRDRWLERKFTSIHPEIGIKKIASNKMRDNWTKTAQHLIKYKQKWKGQFKRVMKEMK